MNDDLDLLEGRLKNVLFTDDPKDVVAAARALLELYKFRMIKTGLERPCPETPEEVVEAVREMMQEAGYELVEIERH